MHYLKFIVSYFLLSSFTKWAYDDEIQMEFRPFFILYKSGRLERLVGTETVPPSLDPNTGVVSKDVTINTDTGVSARLYLPKSNQNITSMEKLPILVFYHGGGFMVCSPFSPSYHNYLNSLVSQANVLAVSVHYRRAPEHLLPAAYDDSWTALKWAVSRHDPWLAEHGDFDRIFIAGDSAGGNIVHNIAMRVGSEGSGSGIEKIEGAVLFCPYFWGSKPISGEVWDSKNSRFLDRVWKTVNPPAADMDDPRLNPTAGVEGKERLRGLACRRVLVSVADNDYLAARGRKYCKDLKESGWDGEEVELVESEGEGHVFFLDKPESEKALELMKKVVDFMKRT